MKISLLTFSVLLSFSVIHVYGGNGFAAEPGQSAAPGNHIVKRGSETAPPKQARFSGRVEIYVTDWCGYCQQALGYMDSNDIPYVEYNIETDRAAMKRYKELGGRGVPFIIIGSNRLYGFTKEKFEYYMNNSR